MLGYFSPDLFLSVRLLSHWDSVRVARVYSICTSQPQYKSEWRKSGMDLKSANFAQQWAKPCVHLVLRSLHPFRFSCGNVFFLCLHAVMKLVKSRFIMEKELSTHKAIIEAVSGKDWFSDFQCICAGILLACHFFWSWHHWSFCHREWQDTGLLGTCREFADAAALGAKVKGSLPRSIGSGTHSRTCWRAGLAWDDSFLMYF